MERKKWVELIGSVFVAVIFLSSYAAFGSKVTSTNTTTTVAQVQTFLATARGTAEVLGYGPVMNVTVSCQNAANVSKQINDFVSAQNKSVVAFPPYSFQNTSQIIVTAGQLGSYYLYNAISNNVGPSSNCVKFAASAEILLPASMSFVAAQGGSAVIQIPSELRNASQPVFFAGSMASTMNVIVRAIITEQGSIHGANITVQRG